MISPVNRGRLRHGVQVRRVRDGRHVGGGGLGLGLGRAEPGRPQGRREGGGVGRLVRRRGVHVAARAALELLLVALEQFPHLGGLELVWVK